MTIYDYLFRDEYQQLELYTSADEWNQRVIT